MNVNALNKNADSGRDSGALGNTSWIADELIGIRTLEERISKRLKSNPAPNSRALLLMGLRDLNTRVESLDRALDEFSRSRRAA
jgi:hypothetical protein